MTAKILLFISITCFVAEQFFFSYKQDVSFLKLKLTVLLSLQGILFYLQKWMSAGWPSYRETRAWLLWMSSIFPFSFVGIVQDFPFYSPLFD